MTHIKYNPNAKVLGFFVYGKPSRRLDGLEETKNLWYAESVRDCKQKPKSPIIDIKMIDLNRITLPMNNKLDNKNREF